jgi:hypothetical protein
MNRNDGLLILKRNRLDCFEELVRCIIHNPINFLYILCAIVVEYFLQLIEYNFIFKMRNDKLR